MAKASNYDQFGSDYFRERQGNNRLRQLSFELEKKYLQQQVGERLFNEGKLLDVGCSTGEFIEALGWNRKLSYGMEISDYARQIAAKKGIRFDKNLLNAKNYFDLIVFRGTIQYIPHPFEYLQKAFNALKSGGYIAFFATPNSNSIYYKLFKTLPFLEEKLNYLIPNDVSLCMNLKNAGFEILQVEFPYLGTPYADPLRDHWKFIKKLLFRTSDKFPFWKNSMTVLAQKSKNGKLL